MVDRNFQDNFWLIVDFDSTFVQVETLDQLAAIALRTNPQKDQVLKKIRAITEDGMNGKISFDQSLNKRLQLFQANRKNINSLVRLLKKRITPSIARNKKIFQKYKKRIYIVSGGFREYIAPVCHLFGIEKEHLLANQFIFDQKGKVVGFDQSNFLAQKDGKRKQIEALNLAGEIIVVGDGYTDYQIKEAGLATKFYCFTENVSRKKILAKADQVVSIFDQVINYLDLH